jgi:hypothetical protein
MDDLKAKDSHSGDQAMAAKIVDELLAHGHLAGLFPDGVPAEVLSKKNARNYLIDSPDRQQEMETRWLQALSDIRNTPNFTSTFITDSVVPKLLPNFPRTVIKSNFFPNLTDQQTMKLIKYELRDRLMNECS